MRDPETFKPAGPHGWVQWKGTNVCMDVHCKCGEHTHVDDTFTYHVRCCKCGQLYWVNGNVELCPVDKPYMGLNIVETNGE